MNKFLCLFIICLSVICVFGYSDEGIRIKNLLSTGFELTTSNSSDTTSFTLHTQLAKL